MLQTRIFSFFCILGIFLYQQVRACLFGIYILTAIILTHLWYPTEFFLSRYDFLTLCALSFQLFLIVAKLEDWKEVQVILVFHVLGTTMEVFKTHMGSWEYPHAAVLRIEGVPLFTGFMYASVGSYFARSWRIFSWKFIAHPPLVSVWILVGAIYMNFYTHHFWIDIRYVLFLAIVWLFYRTQIVFHITPHQSCKVPLLLAFSSVAGLLWIAENIGTYTKTWAYAGQSVFHPTVAWAKMGSWFLLIFLSYSLVALVHRSQLIRS